MRLITEMIGESCVRYADTCAFRVKVAGQWHEHTYRELWQESDEIAAGLIDWGLKPKERCALIASSSPAWIKAYLGILKAGGVAVPIDKELKQGELRHILSDSGVRLLFTEQKYLDTVLDIVSDLPDLKKIVHLNFAAPQGHDLAPKTEAAMSSLLKTWRGVTERYQISEEDARQLEELVEGIFGLITPDRGKTVKKRGKSLLEYLDDTRHRTLVKLNPESTQDFSIKGKIPKVPVRPDETAVILYTSGTTGRSKGAMLSHQNITSNIDAALQRFELDDTVRMLSFLPINHVFEQVCGILLPLSIGGSVAFAESLKQLGNNLAEIKPNFLLGVPAVFRLLLDRMTKNIQGQTVSRTLFSMKVTRPLVLKKIREALGGSPVFVSGGAALDPAVAAGLRDLGITVYQGYGITETSPIISVEYPGGASLGTAGPPLPGVEIKINQPGHEEVGEIWTKGPHVMQGYFNNPKATNEVLTDGWYHTGDLGRLDEDGMLRICGRQKNLIVTANGKNVYPEEVENELLQSPFISEIMIYGHKVNETVEEVHAMIYPDHDALDSHFQKQNKSAANERDVEELIRQEVLEYGKNLANYKRVRRFTLREDEFPKTTTRKIKRFVVEADIRAE